MNTDISSLIDIRELALGAFSGLPRPYCKKKSTQRRPVPFGPRLPSLGAARFDDCASDCAALALLKAFTAENLPLEIGQWSAPTVDQELQAIFTQLMGTMTYNGDPFAEALHEHHRELFVGVINVDTTETDEVVVPGGRGFAAGPIALKYHPTQILASACSNITAPKIPTFRWDYIKKRFSLPPGNRPPGTNYVAGPYLLVGIPEPETGTLAKGRMWPVWFSALHRRMSIIRSNLERGGCAAAADLNAVVLTFICRLQLIGLQAAFGGRWAGDLASYPYLADYGLMPLPYLQAVRRNGGYRTAQLRDFLKRELAACKAEGVFAVALDGTADFVEDVNDPKECNQFVAELQDHAIAYACAIVGVIHENPGVNGNKMRGHLGSQLERKAESNIRLVKNEDTTTVNADQKMRNGPVPAEKQPNFRWSDDAAMHVSVAAAQAAAADAYRAALRRSAEETLASTGKSSLSWSEFCDAIAKKDDITRKAGEKRFAKLQALGLIEKCQFGRWGLAVNTPTP